MRYSVIIAAGIVATVFGCSDVIKQRAESPDASTGTGGGNATASGGNAASGGASAAGGASGSGGVSSSTGGVSSGTGDGSAASGAGGTTPEGGADGSTANAADVVVCNGGKACTSSEVCCFAAAVLLTPSVYTCSSKPCAAAEVSVACDGMEDCAPTQKCCRVDAFGAGTSYGCRDTCSGSNVACGGPDNCPGTDVCCLSVPLVGSASSTCATACSGLGLYLMCRTNADCPAATPTCADSTALPGFRICQ